MTSGLVPVARHTRQGLGDLHNTAPARRHFEADSSRVTEIVVCGRSMFGGSTGHCLVRPSADDKVFFS